ncbi:anhydro-N-acetylmuramic acid kinase [Flavitalea flava]
MVYRVIGLMSGSSLDGLDIAYVHLQVSNKKWEYTFVQTDCYPYPDEWKKKLAEAPGLSAVDYQLLHTDYGHYLGERVNQFIEQYQLHYQVQLIATHGHTSFHLPGRKMTAQLGDGAALAAVTGINVVSDLRAMDLALGGQGAPIVPIGEKLLLPGYGLFLNLGGIANISVHAPAAAPALPTQAASQAIPGPDSVSRRIAAGSFIAYDVCPANRVLNILAALVGKDYDDGGTLAASGKTDDSLLQRLNALPYYNMPYPKSLANDFGTDTVYPMIRESGLGTADALRTYTEHICAQIKNAVEERHREGVASGGKMLVTGGGAYNHFLIGRLRELLAPLSVEVEVPEKELIEYKEALVMALIGILRWREENNVLSSVTGASRDSIGGAVWIGQDA